MFLHFLYFASKFELNQLYWTLVKIIRWESKQTYKPKLGHTIVLKIKSQDIYFLNFIYLKIKSWIVYEPKFSRYLFSNLYKKHGYYLSCKLLFYNSNPPQLSRCAKAKDVVRRTPRYKRPKHRETPYKFLSASKV